MEHKCTVYLAKAQLFSAQKGMDQMYRNLGRTAMVLNLLLAIALGGFITPSASAQRTVYDSASGPYFSFNASSGILGTDDYATTEPGSDFLLTQFRFVGGVTVANGTLQFQFQDALGTPVTTFSVSFVDPGNFIYDVPASFFPGGNALVIPTSGRLQISTVGATQGQWFLTQSAPVVGTNSTAFGSGAAGNPTLYGAFSLSTSAPEPSTAHLGFLGLMALGMTAYCSRRRK
jgi:hypothetical protein